MFELSVEREFCAAHAIVINGHREPIHGHNWRVKVVVAGTQLDSNGLLCDFHIIERAIDQVIAPFHNQHLNEVAPFDRVNPTAEHVAQKIAEGLKGNVPRSAKLQSVSVSEAPGCVATYRF
jgi:6-pyruvoyltetrahydropterin/6-carboxytetrahydropterin synthase